MTAAQTQDSDRIPCRDSFTSMLGGVELRGLEVLITVFLRVSGWSAGADAPAPLRHIQGPMCDVLEIKESGTNHLVYLIQCSALLWTILFTAIGYNNVRLQYGKEIVSRDGVLTNNWGPIGICGRCAHWA